MPNPLPSDDDQPATRRELAHLQESILSTLSTRIAELRAEMLGLFRDQDQRMAEGFADVERRMSRQTWQLIGALGLWGLALTIVDSMAT